MAAVPWVLPSRRVSYMSPWLWRHPKSQPNCGTGRRYQSNDVAGDEVARLAATPRRSLKLADLLR